MERDTRLKDLDIQLKEKGIQPHDNIFFRVLAQMLEEGKLRIPNFNVKDILKKSPFSNNNPSRPGIPGKFSFKNPFINR